MNILRIFGLFFFIVLLLSSLGILLASFPLTKSIRRDLDKGIKEATVWSSSSPNSTSDRFISNYRPGQPTQRVSVYLFNITNLGEVRQGQKPKLQEVGPYVYRRWWRRENVSLDNFGSVAYTEWAWFTLDPPTKEESADDVPHEAARTSWPWFAAPPKASHLSDEAPPNARFAGDDMITTLNLPLLAVLRNIDRLGSLLTAAQLVVQQYFELPDLDGQFEGLFMHRSAKELLFGYTDPLLSTVKTVLPQFRNSEVSVLPMTAVDTRPSRSAPHDEPPRTTMATGAEQDKPAWAYRAWRGLKEIGCWPQHNETVEGASDGAQFRPGVTEHDELSVFVPEVFRKVALKATDRVSLHGVSLLKYQLTDPTLAPSERFESSTQGLFNVTRCAATGPGIPDASGHVIRDDSATAPPLGPPLYLTLPHFCRASPEIALQTEGTKCNLSRHDLWLGVEPMSGVTLAAAKRLQLVSEFDARYPLFDGDVAPTKLPIFWVEEEGEAPEYDLDAVRGAMQAKRRNAFFSSSSFCCLCSLSAIAVACGLVLLQYISHKGGALTLGLPEAAPTTRSPTPTSAMSIPPMMQAKWLIAFFSSSGFYCICSLSAIAAVLGLSLLQYTSHKGGAVTRGLPEAALTTRSSTPKGATHSPDDGSGLLAPPPLIDPSGQLCRTHTNPAAPSGADSASRTASGSQSAITFVRGFSGAPAAAMVGGTRGGGETPITPNHKRKAAAAKAIRHFTDLGGVWGLTHTPPDTPSMSAAPSNGSQCSASAPGFASSPTNSALSEGLWPRGPRATAVIAPAPLVTSPLDKSETVDPHAMIVPASAPQPRHMGILHNLGAYIPSWSGRSVGTSGTGSEGGDAPSVRLPVSRLAPVRSVSPTTGSLLTSELPSMSVVLPPSRPAVGNSSVGSIGATSDIPSGSMPLPPSRPAARGSASTNAPSTALSGMPHAHWSTMGTGTGTSMTLEGPSESVPLPPSRPAARSAVSEAAATSDILSASMPLLLSRPVARGTSIDMPSTTLSGLSPPHWSTNGAGTVTSEGPSASVLLPAFRPAAQGALSDTLATSDAPLAPLPTGASDWGGGGVGTGVQAVSEGASRLAELRPMSSTGDVHDDVTAGTLPSSPYAARHAWRGS